LDAKTYTTVRQNFAETLDKVCRDHDPVFVTRRKGETVVMMSISDYRSMEETAYLLRSPKNAARLMAAIEEIESGHANIPWPEAMTQTSQKTKSASKKKGRSKPTKRK
jgi:antitoxin YefM